MTFTNSDPNVGPDLTRLCSRAALEWILKPKPRGPVTPTPVAHVIDPGPIHEPSVTWLGHATALIAMGGEWIITDPVFAHRLGPTVARRAPVPLAPDLLPGVDRVMISHNHRDHLDAPSIRSLETLFQPHYIAPLGVDRDLEGMGVSPERITTLGWWDTHTCESGPEAITMVPAQHWSQRGLLDRNRSWWGGYVLEHHTYTLYFAGDSGYCDDFKAIGARFSNIDLGLIPIGAYDPTWFMSPQHMNPEEAGQVMLDVGAKRMIPIHWGTYKLTAEPLDEPPERLKAWGRTRGLEERLAIMPLGGRLTLNGMPSAHPPTARVGG
ncbi:MAG: MBL fold metallo-hydrolase [Myxococcota bacterium]